MPQQLSITEICTALEKAQADLTGYCNSLPGDLFFYQPATKWSAAQQVKHLTTATQTASLAYTLPKFLVRWVGGKPNRPSRAYDELVAKYKQKLQEGGKASGRYVPKMVPAGYGKEKLLQSFTAAMNRMSRAIANRWQEQQTDQYIVAHPLLGKITVRELAYFTIYHTYHHLDSIRELTTR